MSAWTGDHKQNRIVGTGGASPSSRPLQENGRASTPAEVGTRAVEAGQIIFTNVEAEQSPRGRSGFQALFESENVSALDIEEAKSRFFYRTRSDEQKPVKRLFYKARSGSAVIVQTVPLAEADAGNRRGLYFSHALVLAPDQFARIDNNPIPLLRLFNFMTTVEEAMAAGDTRTGSFPLLQLKVLPLAPKPEALARLDALEPSQRRMLLLLAAQTAADPQTRNRLSLSGAAEDAFDLVEALVRLLPAPLRAACSFDTFFVKGEPGVTPYWAVGVPRDEPSHPNLRCFSLDRGRFEHSFEVAPRTPYERWLESHASSPARLLVPQADHAYASSRWFDGEDATLEAVDRSTFRDVGALCGDVLERRLLDRLRQQAGAMTGKLAPQALQWAHAPGSDAAAACSSGFPPDVLAEWTMALMARSAVPLTPEERRDTLVIADSTGDRMLRWALLRRAGQWERLAGELRSAKDDEFQRFAQSMLSNEPLEVEWAARPDGRGCFVGARVAQERDSDLHLLLQALMGVAPARDEGWRGLAARRPFRRERQGGSRDGSTAIPAGRWLWLMNYLGRASERS